MATTMAAETPPSDVAGADRRRSGRAKRKKHQAHQAQLAQREAEEEAARSHERWRSESQQKVYSTKLMESLTRLHLAGEGGGGGGGGEDQAAAPVQLRGRTVREAADRALAFAAKGKTRWSRAVLMKTASKVKLKFRKAGGRGARGSCALRGLVGSSSGGRWKGKKGKVSVRSLKGKGAAGVQSKVRVLRGLVPGCRKEPINVVLEEATDYIAALEMQVRTMNALAQLLSGGDAAGSSGANELMMIRTIFLFSN